MNLGFTFEAVQFSFHLNNLNPTISHQGEWETVFNYVPLRGLLGA